MEINSVRRNVWTAPSTDAIAFTIPAPWGNDIDRVEDIANAATPGNEYDHPVTLRVDDGEVITYRGWIHMVIGDPLGTSPVTVSVRLTTGSAARLEDNGLPVGIARAEIADERGRVVMSRVEAHTWGHTSAPATATR